VTVETSAKLAYIGLGANLGDPIATLRDAAQRLDRLGRVTARSSLYRTPAWGVTEQPPFVNAVVGLTTGLEPHALLRALKSLEDELGRTATYRWGPRTIDLDILTYDRVHIDEPELTIPHARLAERAFVLVPLAEVAPAYAALRDALPAGEIAAIERIGPFEREGVPR
jgi:2-amino-4-hydroxy-6-hydroxymethyldihydropteridine diphosphokinase